MARRLSREELNPKRARARESEIERGGREKDRKRARETEIDRQTEREKRGRERETERDGERERENETGRGRGMPSRGLQSIHPPDHHC